MVLAELGSKVAIALRKMTQATIVDETVMNDMLQEICRALMQADVNVKQVKQMRESIKKNVNVEELANGLNKRKMLERAVCDELCSMLDPGREPYVPQKKKANVIMFVGAARVRQDDDLHKVRVPLQAQGFRVRLCATRAPVPDQLKQNATKAKILAYGSYTETDPHRSPRRAWRSSSRKATRSSSSTPRAATCRKRLFSRRWSRWRS